MRAEGENHLPRPAGHTSLDTAQDTADFLGCECTLLAHIQFSIHQYPQVLLLRAALNSLIVQTVFVLGIDPTHVQDLALGLVELREVCTGSPLQPAKVPPDGTSLPSSMSTAPHSSVSSANLLRVHSIPLSMSPIKMLNSSVLVARKKYVCC